MISLGKRLLGIGVMLAGVAGGAGAFAWRLSQGPLSVPFLSSVIADRLSDPAQGYFVGVGDVVIAWTDDPLDGHGRLDIRLQSVSVRDINDIELAAVPEAGLGLSMARLFEGQVRPTRLELIRPRVVMGRLSDGSIGFSMPRNDLPAHDDAAGAVPDAAATPVAAGLLKALAHPPDSAPLLGLLHTLAIRDGEVVLNDPLRNARWRANPATIVLSRGAKGIEGSMRLNLTDDGNAGAGRPPVPVEARLSYDSGQRSTALNLSFSLLSPAALAGLASELAPLARVDVPLNGTARATLNGSFDLTDVAFAVAAAPSPLAQVLRVEGEGKINTIAQQILIDKASVRVTAETLQPSRLAGLAPELQPLAGVGFPLSGQVELRQDGASRSGRAVFDLGGGSFALDKVYPTPLPVKGGRLEIEGDAATGGTLTLKGLNLDGPTLSVTAKAGIQDGKVALNANAELNGVPVARLGELWPAVAAPKPRDWSLTNITAGRLTTATAEFSGWAPLEKPFNLEPERIQARLVLDGATIHYFRPLPPVTDVTQAVGEFDGKTFTVRTQGGQVVHGAAPPVQAVDGLVTIINVGTPREDLTVDMNLQGPLNSILGVIDLPPLGYPAKLGIKPEETAGDVNGHLHMTFPLFDNLKMDDLQVQVDGHVAKAAIAKVVAGRDATAGELDVKLDTKGMNVTGKARFDGIPITVNWRENFSAAAKGPATVLEAQGRADVKQIASFVPDLIDYAQGPAEVKVRYTAETGRATLNVNADLNPTTLLLDPLGWSKPPGTAGKARLDLLFKDGKPTRISDLRVEGGGLAMTGGITFNAAGEASRFDINRFTVGKTDIRAVATRNKSAGYDVKVTGAAIDANALMKADKTDPNAAPVEDTGADEAAAAVKKSVWNVDLALDRLLFGDDRGLSKVTGLLVRQDGDWNSIEIRGSTPPKGSLTIQREPLRSGVNRLRITGDDAGNALLALDVTDRVRGGRLTVTGYAASTKPKAAIDGTIDMRDYTVVDAPALARILNAMSITGLTELLSGQGIGFGSMTGKFRKAGDLLTLKEVRTSGGALGLTVDGTINLAKETAHLNGTIVPVYGVNRIVGQIPLLGDLLSGGPGQGIFAATWTIDGKLDDPDVSVNPLALLTPGFLRNLFFGGQ